MTQIDGKIKTKTSGTQSEGVGSSDHSELVMETQEMRELLETIIAGGLTPDPRVSKIQKRIEAGRQAERELHDIMSSELTRQLEFDTGAFSNYGFKVESVQLKDYLRSGHATFITSRVAVTADGRTLELELLTTNSDDIFGVSEVSNIEYLTRRLNPELPESSDWSFNFGVRYLGQVNQDRDNGKRLSVKKAMKHLKSLEGVDEAKLAPIVRVLFEMHNSEVVPNFRRRNK